MAALISGKQSILSLLECVAVGHELVCIACLQPKSSELSASSESTESKMFSTVGTDTLPSLVAECLDVPLVDIEISG